MRAIWILIAIGVFTGCSSSEKTPSPDLSGIEQRLAALESRVADIPSDRGADIDAILKRLAAVEKVGTAPAAVPAVHLVERAGTPQERDWGLFAGFDRVWAAPAKSFVEARPRALYFATNNCSGQAYIAGATPDGIAWFVSERGELVRAPFRAPLAVELHSMETYEECAYVTPAVLANEREAERDGTMFALPEDQRLMTTEVR